MEGSLISWWAGEPVRRYLWSACHRVDEPGRVSRPSFKKCTQAISWRAESATGNEKTPVVKGETRKLRKVTGALFIYPRSRRDRPHAAVPPTTPRHTLLLIRESCAHIRFNLLSLLVWIWLIITMGIPKQQILKWMTDFLFIYLFFSIPGSRLEMSFVKKVKLSPRRITFFPGSCPSSRALHGARLFSPRPAALSLLSERERVTPPEPQRRRDWGGTKKKKAQKGLLSALGADGWCVCLAGDLGPCGPTRSSQHALYRSHKALRNSCTVQRACVLCPDLRLRGGQGFTRSRSPWRSSKSRGEVV